MKAKQVKKFLIRYLCMTDHHHSILKCMQHDFKEDLEIEIKKKRFKKNRDTKMMFFFAFVF